MGSRGIKRECRDRLSSLQTARGWSPTNCPLHPWFSSLGPLHVWLPLMPNAWAARREDSGASAGVACPRPLGAGRTSPQSRPEARAPAHPRSPSVRQPQLRGSGNRARAWGQPWPASRAERKPGHSDETPDTSGQGPGLEGQSAVGHQCGRVQMRPGPRVSRAGPAVPQGQTGTCPAVKGLAELPRPLQLQAGAGP